MDKKLSTIALDVGYKKGQPVVKQVSFDVKAGEIIAVVGANGAGKSTILKTITRQLNKLDGNIRICDMDDSEINEEAMAKKVSMVTTERIHPELMTCYDVVATGRYPYTGRLGILSDDDREAIAYAIKLVGAEAIVGEDFSKVSDGQRQRVMLARAICQDTDIMILDEPTSFLDIQFKLDILTIIRKLAHEQNKAVVMSIHELEFVPAIADAVIGIYDNSVYKIGSPREILTGENLEVMYGTAAGEGKIMADAVCETKAFVGNLYKKIIEFAQTASMNDDFIDDWCWQAYNEECAKMWKENDPDIKNLFIRKATSERVEKFLSDNNSTVRFIPIKTN